jgi:hypothetical protein
MAISSKAASVTWGNSALPLLSPSVILREVAGSIQRLDSATSLRYAQNDRKGFAEVPWTSEASSGDSTFPALCGA